MENISFLTIITIAILGSFGHCVGMCGGIIIAYSSTKVQNEWSKTTQTVSHILYSLGRVTTYTVLGAFFGFLGSVTTFNDTANGVFLIIIATSMILVGLSLFGKIKFLTTIEHSISKQAWYQKSFKRLISTQSLSSFYFLGMLNGLLPCGFVYFFAITAASSGSALWGAIVMFIFGLSTIPALFSLGFFVGLFQQSEFRTLMIKLASIAVILYGVYMFYLGIQYFVK